MAVILRIFRARVKPGMHAHFARLCRETSMPLVMAQPGIIYFHIGKPMPQRPDEFVLVSAWEDLESIQRFAGERWEEPIIMPGEAPLVEEVSVQHYIQEDESVRSLGQGPRVPSGALQQREDAIVRGLRLSDDQWEQISALLPPPKREGRPRADDRRTLEGILYVLRMGCRWQDMPSDFGSYVTCWRRYASWVADGTWERVWHSLMQSLDPREQTIWAQTLLNGGCVPFKGNGHGLRQPQRQPSRRSSG
jgi:transposase/heme-degrading monooxygenase HmoA